jgi:hypothetical protein
VLDLPPVECASDASFSAHVLVCEKDAVMAHWSLRSFLRQTSAPVQIYVHDDGSCSAPTLATLQEKFPGAVVISRRDAEAKVLPHISSKIDLVHWWYSEYIAIKCLDFYLIGESEWVIILDPDVLFFQEPQALFTNSREAMWMEDCFYSLYIDPAEAQERFDVVPLQINAGVGRMLRDSIDQSLLQEVLRFKSEKSVQERARQRGLPRYEDQTYHALLAARHPGSQLLPSSYQVATELGLHGVIAKHYTTPARFWFYEEGIPRVARQLKMELPRWLKERG